MSKIRRAFAVGTCVVASVAVTVGFILATHDMPATPAPDATITCLNGHVERS